MIFIYNFCSRPKVNLRFLSRTLDSARSHNQEKLTTSTDKGDANDFKRNKTKKKNPKKKQKDKKERKTIKKEKKSKKRKKSAD